MSRPATAPAPLLVAASLVAVEGLLLLGYAVLEVASVDSDRVAVAATTGLFFLAYGVGLLVCARGLSRRRSWARSPVVLAQLIQLGVAWSFWGGSTTAVAIAVALVAVIVLVGVFHPASIEALEAADADPTV
ncbi:hypothetical protein GON03_01240 [Nocardioides sp. MAH-18]|uniref:Integral membrane protein n=1 Tax=Nocardioides agri TaxID=2682843 RepID=A0A6L6XMJ7_9ACTN|nr:MULTISPECIES: hypothetical protein [unclassified Nocardioides]MBA2956643.1 hypothetical protein [Nocardioides sp. CGMCC 1.13656]MVQ47786.1 hypothetical protein [Nocardioides sp. MAH-18]